MIRLALVLAWLVPALAAAMTPGELLEGGHVRVRVETEPARQVVVGQQTRLLIEILTDTWFTKAPRYPELGLEGAVVLMPEQLGTNFSERIDGVTFAAQRRGYVIYPQRAGPLEIPAIAVRLGVSTEGEPSEPFSVTTPPLRLQVVLPPGAEGREGFVTTPRLDVTDHWDKPLDGLHVGDAVKRTVRLGADQALGMLLPEIAFDAPPGIALYPGQPRTEDRVNRGRYRGERIETATYVLQREGEFTLPAIEVHWWNPERGALVTETLEARTFEVLASDRAEAVSVKAERWEDWRPWLARAGAYLRAHWITLLVAVLAAGLAVRLARSRGPRLIAALAATAQRRRSSEAARFRELERSVRGGDANAVVRDYWRWRDRLAAERPRPGSREMQRAAEATGFADAWAGLEAARYGASQEAWDPADLRRALRAFRAALRAGRRPGASHGGLLNPRGAGSR